MGPQDSEVSNALLDAVDRVLRDEGYGAATSRRIAQEAGLKQQLVYYYFQSMDELLLAAFKARTKRALDRLEQDLTSHRSLRAIWEDMETSVDSKITSEYMAIANHHTGVRREIKRFVNKSRQMQIEAITKLARNKADDSAAVTPGALAFLMSSTAILLRRESQNGITSAHDDIRQLVRWAIERFE
jgi:AcrR family transcriptional regulator